MPLISKLRHRYAPEVIALFILTLLFVSLLPLPYFIHSDAPTSLKSSQQFAQGLTQRLGDLWLPDIHDLSQNQSFWVVWFSPGTALFYYPLLALGIPLGLAAKTTSYLLMISGSWGWLAFAKQIKTPQAACILFAFTVPFYAVSVSGAQLSTGEIVVFATMPWIYQFGLRLIETWQNSNPPWTQTLWHTSLLGFLLGSSYFLKYSAVISAASFCLYLITEILCLSDKSRFTIRQKLVLISLIFLTFIIVPVLLSLFNAHLANTTSYLDESIFADLSPNHPRGVYLLIALVSAPALYLFQASRFWMHLIFFSDRWIPFFREIAFENRIIPLVIITFPLGLILIRFCWRYRHYFSRSHWLLFIILGYFPFLPLVYLSQKISYNYLVFNTRHGVGHFLIIEILIITILWNIFKEQKNHISLNFKSIGFKNISIFILFYIIPNSFHLMNFVSGYQVKFPRNYIATNRKIYNPSLSLVNSKGVVDIAQNVKKHQNDIVVLAMNEPSAFNAWLDFDGRVLPIAFADELFRQALQSNALNLHSDRPFFTTEPLQIILVVSKSIESNADWLNLIKGRFPQAETWYKQSDPVLDRAEVSIYVADLTR